jgi:hypothetical protein
MAPLLRFPRPKFQTLRDIIGLPFFLISMLLGESCGSTLFAGIGFWITADVEKYSGQPGDPLG